MKNTYEITNTKMAIATTTNNASNLVLNSLNGLQSVFTSAVKSLTPVKNRKVVVIGSNNAAQKLNTYFNSNKAFGFKSLGCFEANNNQNVAALKDYCLENGVEEIYFAQSGENATLISELSNFADKNFIYFRIAGNSITHKKESAAFYFEDVPVMAMRKEPLSSRFNQITKRAFDIVFSLMVLAVLIPFVFPIIALAIKWESKGPVFFVQNRPGKKNALFPCFKFRSMTVNNAGEQQASKNDMRITKVGAFLRKTSLDELPQFMNVLLGHMSVVGPRPNMVKQLEFYSQHIDNYSFRHFVTPGITGWAQINGFRGETQTIDLMEKRVELDIEYMQRWSLFFDCKIVFLTAWNIIKGEENAY